MTRVCPYVREWNECSQLINQVAISRISSNKCRAWMISHGKHCLAAWQRQIRFEKGRKMKHVAFWLRQLDYRQSTTKNRCQIAVWIPLPSRTRSNTLWHCEMFPLPVCTSDGFLGDKKSWTTINQEKVGQYTHKNLRRREAFRLLRFQLSSEQSACTSLLLVEALLQTKFEI